MTLQVQINSSLQIEIDIYKKRICIFREKIGSSIRRVFVPLRVLNQARDRQQEIISGEKCQLSGTWEATIADYADKEYMQFNYLDDAGVRVGYKSFNLSLDEFAIVMIETDAAMVSHAVNIDEPAEKKRRTRTGVQLETFKWMLKECGIVVRQSSGTYLTMKKCMEEALEANPDNDLSVGYLHDLIEQPPLEEIIEMVYMYIFKFEYEERMKNNCPGCINPNKDEHCMTCFHSDKFRLSDKHIVSASNRISANRLFEVCKHVVGFYSIPKSNVTMQVIKTFLNEGVNPTLYANARMCDVPVEINDIVFM